MLTALSAGRRLLFFVSSRGMQTNPVYGIKIPRESEHTLTHQINPSLGRYRVDRSVRRLEEVGRTQRD